MISVEWEWLHKGPDSDNIPNTYAFAYDGFNRLTDTKQYLGNIVADRFVERGLSYDKNSNIRTLRRTSAGLIADSLQYTYSGNHLQTISGTVSGPYLYDGNGNMTCDGANNLDLSYNRLNLIEKVEQDGATIAKYSYLADGTKLSAANADGNGLCYLGSLVYRRYRGLLSLESAAFGDGRIVARHTSFGTSYTPYYFLTDHLGSVRVVVNGSGAVVERSDYYPFGLRWDNPQHQLSDNRYRYNGKEEQGFVGVPYIDYGARMYDPKFGLVWNGRDQLLERHYSISPYVFCGNNPIVRVDSDGKIWDTVWDVLSLAYDVGAAVYSHINGDHEAAKGYWVDAGMDLAAALIPGVPAGISKVIKVADKTTGAVKGAEKAVEAAREVDKAVDAAKSVDKAADAANEAGKAAKNIPNPYGSKGKLDHQEKVRELLVKADKELQPGENVLQEKKIKIKGSNRRPDVQIVGKDGKTRKVFEAERHPNSQRNRLREEEYERMNLEQETHAF